MDEQPTPKSDELRDLIQSLIAGMTSGYQEFKAMEQRLAEATTLLQEAVADDSPGVPSERDGGKMHCYHCGGVWIGPGFKYQHNPDCTWVKIRAFLAQ